MFFYKKILLCLLTVFAILFYFQSFQVSDLGPRALAISLPFSCVLGLLSSMIATTMGECHYIFSFFPLI
jgi:hypothetical protein